MAKDDAMNRPTESIQRAFEVDMSPQSIEERLREVGRLWKLHRHTRFDLTDEQFADPPLIVDQSRPQD